MIKKAINSQGFRSASIFTFGNTLGTALSAIAMILISRGLGPAQFGIFSAAFSVLIIATKFTDLGINIAAQRYIAQRAKDDNKAKSMISTMFYAKLILLLAISVVGYMISPLIAKDFLKIDNVEIVRISFILLSFTTIYEYYLSVMQAVELYRKTALMIVLQAIGKLLAAIWLISSNLLSALHALYIYALAPIIGIFYGGFTSRLRPWARPKNITTNTRYLRKTMTWTSIAVISSAVADNVDVLLVQNMLSSYHTGLWSAAARIAAFAGLIGISFGSVLNIRVAKYKEKKNLDKYLKKAKIASIGMFFAVLALIPFGRIGLELTVGPEYLQATTSLTLLLIATAFTVASSPYVALFYLFEKPQYYAISGALLIFILITGDLILIPKLGLEGAGYVKIATRIIIFIFTIIYANFAYKDHTSRS